MFSFVLPTEWLERVSNVCLRSPSSPPYLIAVLIVNTLYHPNANSQFEFAPSFGISRFDAVSASRGRNQRAHSHIRDFRNGRYSSKFKFTLAPIAHMWNFVDNKLENILWLLHVGTGLVRRLACLTPLLHCCHCH